MAVVNFDPIARNDSDDLDGTVTTAAGGVQNITGFTIWFYLKRNRTDADADALWKGSTATTGVSIVSAAAGTFTVTIPKATTGALTRDTTLWYDAQLMDASGKLFTVQRGTYPVVLDVVQATS